MTLSLLRRGRARQLPKLLEEVGDGLLVFGGGGDHQFAALEAGLAGAAVVFPAPGADRAGDQLEERGLPVGAARKG